MNLFWNIVIQCQAEVLLRKTDICILGKKKLNFIVKIGQEIMNWTSAEIVKSVQEVIECVWSMQKRKM